jgi:hypothetical protein
MSEKHMRKDLRKEFEKFMDTLIKGWVYSQLQSDLNNDLVAIRELTEKYVSSVGKIRSNLEKLKEAEYLNGKELLKKLAWSMEKETEYYLDLLNNTAKTFSEVFHPTRHSNYYTETYLESTFVDLDVKVRLEKVVDKIKELEEEFYKKETNLWDEILYAWVKVFRSVSYKYDGELIKYMVEHE